jgi:hypothetical protein
VALLDDRIHSNTSEREESPKQRNDDPTCKELFRKLVCCPVKTSILSVIMSNPREADDNYLKGHMMKSARNKKTVMARAM